MWASNRAAPHRYGRVVITGKARYLDRIGDSDGTKRCIVLDARQQQPSRKRGSRLRCLCQQKDVHSRPSATVGWLPGVPHTRSKFTGGRAFCRSRCVGAQSGYRSRLAYRGRAPLRRHRRWLRRLGYGRSACGPHGGSFVQVAFFVCAIGPHAGTLNHGVWPVFIRAHTISGWYGPTNA